jgi:hypothetical protein
MLTSQALSVVNFWAIMLWDVADHRERTTGRFPPDFTIMAGNGGRRIERSRHWFLLQISHAGKLTSFVMTSKLNLKY